MKGLARIASSGNPEVTDIVAAKNTNLMGCVCDLLCHKNSDIFREALRYVGGVSSADDDYIIQILIQNEVIEKITNVMYSANSEIVKEGLWTLSNIVASGVNCIEAFLKSSAP
jgi:hypothetical protein